MLKQLFLLIIILLTSQYAVIAQTDCDTKGPTPICETIVVVNVTSEGESKINAESFDNGSWGCENETLTFSILREEAL